MVLINENKNTSIKRYETTHALKEIGNYRRRKTKVISIYGAITISYTPPTTGYG